MALLSGIILVCGHLIFSLKLTVPAFISVSHIMWYAHLGTGENISLSDIPSLTTQQSARYREFIIFLLCVLEYKYLIHTIPILT